MTTQRSIGWNALWRSPRFRTIWVVELDARGVHGPASLVGIRVYR